jgi:hypothetical protein
MSSEEGIDAKTRDYLEGSDELLGLLSATGKNDKSPIMKLREDKSKRAFFFFAREFLPCVVKRLYFRVNKLESLLSEYVTVSDEAFTLFLLENNVARWEAMFERGTTKSDDSMPSQKYQAVNGGEEKNAGKDGYGLQAVLRYNEYYRYITQARSKMDANTLETELLQKMEDLHDEGKGKKKNKNKRKRDGELNLMDETGKPIEVLCDL